MSASWFSFSRSSIYLRFKWQTAVTPQFPDSVSLIKRVSRLLHFTSDSNCLRDHQDNRCHWRRKQREKSRKTKVCTRCSRQGENRRGREKNRWHVRDVKINDAVTKYRKSVERAGSNRVQSWHSLATNEQQRWLIERERVTAVQGGNQILKTRLATKRKNGPEKVSSVRKLGWQMPILAVRQPRKPIRLRVARPSTISSLQV